MGSPRNLPYLYSPELKATLPPLCFQNDVYQSVTSLRSTHSESPLSGSRNTPVQGSQTLSTVSLTPSAASLLQREHYPGKRQLCKKPANRHTSRVCMPKPCNPLGAATKANKGNFSKQIDYGSVTKTKDAPIQSINHTETITENCKEKQFSDESSLTTKNPSPRLEYLKRVRLHTYGCVISLAVAFMCLFSCFLSLKSLQSTVHSSWRGIGVTSLSCIYGAGVLSCVLAPLIIDIFGHKFTMSSSMLLFLVYIGCNMLPEEHLYFLIPASLLLGCSLGMLWTSACAFITSTVNFYASVIKFKKPDELLCKFNGIFYTIFSTAHFWAHLISGVVLNTAGKSPSQTERSLSTPSVLSPKDYSNDSTSEGLTNATRQGDSLAQIHTSQGFKCGGHFEERTPLFVEQTRMYYDNVSSVDTLSLLTRESPAYKAWLLLCSVYIILVVVSVMIVLLFLRKRPEAPAPSTDDKTQTGIQKYAERDEVKRADTGHQTSSLATLALLKDPRLQLLVPLIVFTAMKEAFVYSDYTKFYISCSMGVHSIGMVMITYGMLFTTGSLFIGLVVKHIKGYVIIIAGALFEAGNLMVLLWWNPHVGDVEIFYVIAASMGVCDAIWKTQMSVTLGLLFYNKLESAFALHRLVIFLGLSLSFACSHFLFLRTKIYLMGVLLVIGLVMYAVIHLKSTGSMKSADRMALRLVPLVSV